MGAIAGGVSFAGGDSIDRLGHGTAVAGAIREKAPEAALYAVKIFDRRLSAEIDTIVRALEWCREQRMDLVNLSLGTANNEHRDLMERAAARAEEKGTALVAAREMSGAPSLPGCLPSVIGVGVDWECSRDEYQVKQLEDGPIFIASAYPREIPGVSRERNMSGISFAVANMTGFVARAREFAPDVSTTGLKLLLDDQEDE